MARTILYLSSWVKTGGPLCFAISPWQQNTQRLVAECLVLHHILISVKGMYLFLLLWYSTITAEEEVHDICLWHHSGLPCVRMPWVRHNHHEYNIVTKTPSVNTSRCRLRSSLTCTRVYLKRNFFLPWIIKIIPGPKVFWNNLLPCEKEKQVGKSCMAA